MHKLLKIFMAPYTIKSVIGLLTKLVEVVFEICMPLIIAHMIDAATASASSATIDESSAAASVCSVTSSTLTAALAGRALLLLACATVSYACTLVCQYYAAQVSQGLGTDIRDALYHKSLFLSAQQAERITSGSLITRITNDISQIQLAVALGIRQASRWPLLSVGSSIACLLIDPMLGAVALTCCAACAVVFYLIMKTAVPLYATIQAHLDEIASFMQQFLSGIRVIRATNNTDREVRQFKAVVATQTKSLLDVSKISSYLGPATYAIMYLGILIVLWLVAGRHALGELTQGSIVAFVSYMTTMLISIGYLVNLFIIFLRAEASARRVNEILSIPDTNAKDTNVPANIVDQTTASEATIFTDKTDELEHITKGETVLTPAQPTPSVPALICKHVSFSYSSVHSADGAANVDSASSTTNVADTKIAEADSAAISSYALQDFSCVIQRGQTVGLIGGTGAGKSTAAQLFSGIYQADAGEILAFGLPIERYSHAQRVAHIGYVDQTPSLMSGTIRSNLCWRAPEASDEQLWDALRCAQAADFIANLPQGLQSRVEANGRNFSGGQRQRLSIARTLVCQPQLLILDDVFSALDYRTAAYLQQALRRTRQNLTTILISQQVNTLMHADTIIVLHHGIVQGQGTHQELLETCEIYRELYTSQQKHGASACLAGRDAHE